jgi:AraC-like DNA-binding protein/mannose-6-phosphate isomerase-like protein (cupin superfamily)
LRKENQPLPVYSLQSFSAPETSDRQFQIEVFDANRHFAVKYPHRHDFFEVLFIRKGSGFHVIDDNKYEIKPPCIFFMSPGQAHKLELSHDIDGFIFIFTSEFYLLQQINPNRLLEFPFFFTLERNNPPLLLSDPVDVRFIENLFSRGIQKLAQDPENSVDFLRSLLDLILVTASSLYMVDDSMLNRGKGHILVKRFYQLVEENYQNNLMVNDYASMLAITPNHLSQVIRLLTGKTASDVLQSKQILEIKRLLIHSNLGVSEIAHLLNFADQSYFTKFFKRATGTTPVQFRSESMKTT